MSGYVRFSREEKEQARTTDLPVSPQVEHHTAGAQDSKKDYTARQNGDPAKDKFLHIRGTEKDDRLSNGEGNQ